MKLNIVFILFFFIVACSNRAVYEGIRSGDKMECSTLPPSQYDECMEKTNKTFDEYERERKEIIGQ